MLEEEKFHNKYLIQNVENKKLLTDTLELHFIEISKMKEIDENDLLSIWVGFLKNPNNEKIISMEKKYEELLEAKIELSKISRNPEELEPYKMWEDARNSKVSALLSAYNKGVKETNIEMLEMLKILKELSFDKSLSKETRLAIAKKYSILLKSQD